MPGESARDWLLRAVVVERHVAFGSVHAKDLGLLQSALDLLNGACGLADAAVEQDAQQSIVLTVADVTDTEKAVLIALARAAHDGNGRTLANLCEDIEANNTSTVHRAIVALRRRGWAIPNRRNGAGYSLKGSSMESASGLLRNDAQRTPKQR